MSKIVNHPTPEQIMKFASLPLMPFDKSEFSEYLAFSAHFASCEECRKLKNEMVSFVEKYEDLLCVSDDIDIAERLHSFMDSEAKDTTAGNKEYIDSGISAQAAMCAIDDVSDAIAQPESFGYSDF